jgi:glucosamine-6-phosphate deaminase
MQVHIYPTKSHVARAAAAVFMSELLRKPDAVLGLATGSTPVQTYNELIRLHEANLIDFSQATSFNLDEYVALAPSHYASYRRFMDENLFNHINIQYDNTFVPSGLSRDTEKYDYMIEAAGGIDLQLLGIGSDGHIGFNEPSDEFVYPTNIVKLSEETRADNAGFFDDPAEMPQDAISMGIGTIFNARRIILLATGANKAKIIARTIKGPITPRVPASILRLHGNCQILLDEEAAEGLDLEKQEVTY